jgi:hypothetical protein
MGRLDSLRVSETLGPADPVVRSQYTFVAPDRMRLDSGSRYQLIVVGRTQYQRGGGAKHWNVSRGAPRIKVPLLTWSGFKAVASRIVGGEKSETGASTIVSFFSGDVSNPLWFRLWIDGDRHVHRMEMRALGHFMDQRLFAFDERLRIEAPL